MARPNCYHIALAALAGLCCASPAMAQMPPDIVAKIAAIGRVVDTQKTAEIYTPLQEKEPYAGIKVTRDVAYGRDARNVVDVFTADAPSMGARPVLMFVHGGGLIRGSKRTPGSAFYDNIMVWAVRNGMIGVNVEYRLAPAHAWPAGQEDMAAAVRFVNEHAGEYGGDPAKIFLMGHSAGATHVSTYVAHPEFHSPKGSGLAGAIFSSTPAYDLTKEPANEGRTAYYGSDASKYAERSALQGLLKTSIPFMFSAAELDPPTIEAQFHAFKEILCKSEHGCARSVFLPHHSHMSESYSINTADKQLTNEILAFVRERK
jgi:acetyl esterase/lipase